MPERPRRLLFALTSHGLGHATRSLAIARALHARSRVELWLAAEIPRPRLALDLPAPFALRAVGYEPGTLQRSCFEMDVPGTVAAYRRFLAEREARLAAERRFLRQAGIDAVVSDVPALPVRAATALGIPSVAIANFTWDWILEPLVAGTDLADLPRRLADDYAGGSVHLRLPFGPDGSPLAASEPAPLVARRAALPRGRVLERLGLADDPARPVVVVCPGGWEAEGWSEIVVEGCRDQQFVTVGDLPVRAPLASLRALPHALLDGVSFPDLVGAADAVLAKPGYGIASECALHGTPLVAIERPGFRETPVLLEGFARYEACAPLALADFFAGRWGDALERVLRSPSGPLSAPRDGDARVAGRLAELLDLEPAVVAAGA